VLNADCACSLLSARWRAIAHPTGRQMLVHFADGARLLDQARCQLRRYDREPSLGPGEITVYLWDGLDETVDLVIGRDDIPIVVLPADTGRPVRLVYSGEPELSPPR
jgi:hypothetical protein